MTDRSDGVGERLAGDDDAVSQAGAQLLRAASDRVTTWRSRLDQTTNWAVVVLAAVLTWAFSSPDNPHYVLLIGVVATTVFLGVEAHRFRQYDAWRMRLRSLEANLFAGLLDADPPERADWRTALGRDLRRPSLDISFVDAVGHRLRRVYAWLLGVLVLSWIVRVTTFTPGERGVAAAAVGSVPGTVVVAAVALYVVALAALSAWSLRGEGQREFGDEGPDRS